MFRNRIFIVLVCTLLFALVAPSAWGQSPRFLKQRCFGASEPDQGRGIAIDGSGNMFLTGKFEGSVDFGWWLFSIGESDVFVGKYDAGWNAVWCDREFSGSWDEGTAVAVDGFGNVYLTGRFSSEMFVIKYDNDGISPLWTKKFAQYSYGNDIAVDGAGNVIVTGNYSGTIDFGDGPHTSSSGDVFIAKFDGDGNIIWSKSFGNFAYDHGWGVAVDASGNVYATGSVFGEVDFGGGTRPTLGWDDIYVVKYTAAGAHAWSHRYGGVDHDEGFDITVDGSGDVLVAGNFMNVANLGGSDKTCLGREDIFIAKYSSSGSHIWSRAFGDEDNWSEVEDLSICTDGYNNILLTGAVDYWSVDFGGGPVTGCTFIAKFDPSCNHIWSDDIFTLNGGGSDITVDGSGDVLVTGWFEGQAKFGYDDTVSSAGSSDIFVAKFSEEPCVLPQITDCIPREVTLDFCPVHSTCDVDFFANTSGDYTEVQKIVLERKIQGEPIWVEEDSIVAPIPAPDWNLTCRFNDHFSDGTHWFRIVFYWGDGSKCISKSDSVVANRGVPVMISNFSLEYTDNGVVLHWELGEPSHVKGYNIYRATCNNQDLERLNARLLPKDSGNLYVDDNVEAGTTYRYRLGVVDDEDEWMSQLVSITVPAADLQLHQNYPNPFNPTTTIPFVINENCHVNLKICDASGRVVRTLVDQSLCAGLHTKLWDGCDTKGNPVASGVYFYRLTTGSKTLTRKATLLK